MCVCVCVCARARTHVHALLHNHGQLSAVPWTLAHQDPLAMEFSRQDHWSGLPVPTPVDLPDLEIEPASLSSPALAGGFFTTSVI